MENYEKVCKIDDPRLLAYTKRIRSGKTQVFHTGSDERDFERFRKEGGNRGVAGVIMHDKPDAIRIKPPEKHYYALLIDGEWWWVNGCAECIGYPRDWMTYVECEEHDVCRTCKKKREDAKVCWAGKNGWQCSVCNDAQKLAEKEEALANMPSEHEPWDYHGVSDITCPYCALKVGDSWEHEDAYDEEMECHRCDNRFTFTAVVSVTFDCSRI